MAIIQYYILYVNILDIAIARPGAGGSAARYDLTGRRAEILVTEIGRNPIAPFAETPRRPEAFRTPRRNVAMAVPRPLPVSRGAQGRSKTAHPWS